MPVVNFTLETATAPNPWAVNILFGAAPATVLSGTLPGTSEDGGTATTRIRLSATSAGTSLDGVSDTILNIVGTSTSGGTSLDGGTSGLVQSVLGTCYDEDGTTPLAGVLLYLIDQATDAVIATETSGVDGTYEFAAVAPGTYHVAAEYEGKAAPSHSFVVVGGG